MVDTYYEKTGEKMVKYTDYLALKREIDRYATLLGAAYQLAGLVGAPKRFLDAFSATMGYKGDADKLLPVTLDEIKFPCSFDDCNNTVRHPICDDCDHLLRMED